MLRPDQLSCTTPQLADTPQYLLLCGLWGPLGVLEVRGVHDPDFNKFGCLFGCVSHCVTLITSPKVSAHQFPYLYSLFSSVYNAISMTFK